MIGLLTEDLTQERRGFRCVRTAFELVRVTEAAAIPGFCEPEKFAGLFGRGGADAANGYIRAAIERIYGIHEWSGQFVRPGDGDGEEFAFAARLERVQDGESEDVVDVVT